MADSYRKLPFTRLQCKLRGSFWDNIYLFILFIQEVGLDSIMRESDLESGPYHHCGLKKPDRQLLGHASYPKLTITVRELLGKGNYQVRLLASHTQLMFDSFPMHESSLKLPWSNPLAHWPSTNSFISPALLFVVPSQFFLATHHISPCLGAVKLKPILIFAHHQINLNANILRYLFRGRQRQHHGTKITKTNIPSHRVHQCHEQRNKSSARIGVTGH